MSWTMRHRRRHSSHGMVQLEYGYYKEASPSPSDVFYSTVYDSPYCLSNLRVQETWDVDRKVHPRDKNSDDYGGPFSSKKLEIRFDLVPAKADTVDFLGWYYLSGIDGIAQLQSTQTNAMLLADQATLEGLYSSIAFPSTDLASYGPRAFNKLDPTRDKDLPDITQLVAELIREGIPNLPLKTLRSVKRFRDLTKGSGKRIGKEYLNANFGWLPILSDVEKILKTYLELDARLAQLRKDNGQNVRRSGTLEYSKSSSVRSPLDPNANIYIYPGNGFYNRGLDSEPYGPSEYWTETEERVWFAGKGSYILPIDLQEAPDRSKMQDYLALLKSVPSPATVYELLPWSWLVDYFLNVGDVIQQAIGSGVGEYTADYCYLMRKRVETTYYAVTSVGRYGLATGTEIPSKSRNAQCVVKKTTLERIAATPFGFGLSVGGLSARRLAILTALGLSRQNFI